MAADKNVEVALTLAAEQFTASIKQAGANIEAALAKVTQAGDKAGASLDQSLAFKMAQRLTDRAAADPHQLGQRSFTEGLLRRQLSA